MANTIPIDQTNTTVLDEDDLFEEEGEVPAPRRAVPRKKAPRRSRRVAVATAIRSQNWPAWGYFLVGGIALVVWLGGTAAQVQTSEAWMAQDNVTSLLAPHFSIYLQLTAFWNGGLNQKQLVSYVFGWAVQAALILFSIGLDLPQQTRGQQWRSGLFSWACAGLILINSMGDWYYSSNFGFWGQLGFAFSLFICTFCFGYVAIWAVHRGLRALRAN